VQTQRALEDQGEGVDSNPKTGGRGPCLLHHAASPTFVKRALSKSCLGLVSQKELDGCHPQKRWSFELS
jgi:hypothetical protein